MIRLSPLRERALRFYPEVLSDGSIGKGKAFLGSYLIEISCDERALHDDGLPQYSRPVDVAILHNRLRMAISESWTNLFDLTKS